MRQTGIAAVLAFSALFCLPDARAQTGQGAEVRPPDAIQKTVRRGETIILDVFYSVDEGCRSRGPIDLSTEDPPRFGQATVQERIGHTTFPRSDPLAHCNRRGVDVTRLVYRADPDSTGRDVLTLTATFPSGSTYRKTYVVTIEE
jgi:hypothetical protein